MKLLARAQERGVRRVGEFAHHQVRRSEFHRPPPNSDWDGLSSPKGPVPRSLFPTAERESPPVQKLAARCAIGRRRCRSACSTSLPPKSFPNMSATATATDPPATARDRPRSEAARAAARPCSTEGMRRLMAYHWPGNVFASSRRESSGRWRSGGTIANRRSRSAPTEIQQAAGGRRSVFSYHLPEERRRSTPSSPPSSAS